MIEEQQKILTILHGNSTYEQLCQCQRLIENFEKKHGIENSRILWRIYNNLMQPTNE
jgi:hypothetical protein